MKNKIKKEYMFLGGLMLFGFVIVGIYIFNKSYALDDVNIIKLDCDKDYADSGDEITCSVTGEVSSYQVSALESQVNLSENLEFVSFTVDNTSENEDDVWQGSGEDRNIQLYVANNKSSEFNIGELKVRVKENATVDSNESITLKDTYFYDEQFEEHTILDASHNITKESIDVKINNLYVFGIYERVIYNLDINTTYTDLLKNINTNGEITIFDKDGNEVDKNSVVKTSDFIEIALDNVSEKYYISVLGDVNGDGKSNMLDVGILYSHVLGKDIITFPSNKVIDLAIDLDGNYKFNMLDVGLLYSYVLGADTSLEKLYKIGLKGQWGYVLDNNNVNIEEFIEPPLPLSGSTSSYYYTIRGEKTGTVTVTFNGSLYAYDEEQIYIFNVDEDLNVTVVSHTITTK